MMEIKVISSGSEGNCYLIKNEDTTLLIECGISFKKVQKALDFKVSDIDGCLISHEHMDHAKAAKDLIKAGVDIYTSQGTAEALGIDDSHRFKKIITSTIGSFTIFTFNLEHDAEEPIGFYITDKNTRESLFFITDTMYCKYSFPCDYLMIEVNYVAESINKNKNLDPILRKRIKENHMSLETALDFLKKLHKERLKKIYVLHLSDNNSDAELIKSEIQKATGVSVVIC
jgi:phosphoribosyl 1,2-cyclic phosphodiesterase